MKNERGIIPILLALALAGSVLFGLIIGGHCAHVEGTAKIRCFAHPLHCDGQ